MDSCCSGNVHSMLNFNVCNCMDPSETNFNCVALSELERDHQQQVSTSLPSDWDSITCLRCFPPSLSPLVTSSLSAFHQLLRCHLHSLKSIVLSCTYKSIRIQLLISRLWPRSSQSHKTCSSHWANELNCILKDVNLLELWFSLAKSESGAGFGWDRVYVFPTDWIKYPLLVQFPSHSLFMQTVQEHWWHTFYWPLYPTVIKGKSETASLISALISHRYFMVAKPI